MCTDLIGPPVRLLEWIVVSTYQCGRGTAFMICNLCCKERSQEIASMWANPTNNPAVYTTVDTELSSVAAPPIPA